MYKCQPHTRDAKRGDDDEDVKGRVVEGERERESRKRLKKMSPKAPRKINTFIHTVAADGNRSQKSDNCVVARPQSRVLLLPHSVALQVAVR